MTLQLYRGTVTSWHVFSIRWGIIHGADIRNPEGQKPRIMVHLPPPCLVNCSE